MLLLGLVSCLVLCLSGATVGCVLSVSMYPLRCYFWVLCPGLWLPPASSSLLAAAQWRRGRRLEDFQAFNNHKVCVLSICVVVKYPFEGRIQTPFRYGYDGESRVSNVGKTCQWLWG